MSWGETLFLKKIIQGQRQLAANDTVISVLFNTSAPVSGQEFNKSFIPKTEGTIRIKANGYSVSQSNAAYVFIYENGTEIAKLVLYSSEEKRNVYIDIPIKKNSVYTFGQNSSARVYSLSVGAQIVDGSLFNVIETN